MFGCSFSHHHVAEESCFHVLHMAHVLWIENLHIHGVMFVLCQVILLLHNRPSRVKGSHFYH
uniref:Uncharacterized protein n=1 Tax=Arundo donax TaxID=35708 RepID=A0A0A9B0I1_ARUDO